MAEPGFTWLTPVLCVNDLVKSLEHYERVLGFEVAWKWAESEAFDQPDHPTFACVRRGECCLFLCEQGQGHPGGWVCLNVSSPVELEAIHSQYQDSGADIAEAPADRSWGMREMLVRDPDGNTFRIGCQLQE